MTRDRSHLLTEKVNPNTTDIDTLDTRAIVERIHVEDQRAYKAVGEVLDEIAEAVDHVVRAFRSRGRLIYVGAGTSGRLGVLDAAEIPPTFGTRSERVHGVIAGGTEAVIRSQEGAEDDAEAGIASIADRSVGSIDVVVGIAAGSTTPFVRGAIREARSRGATTVFLTCVPREDAAMDEEVDLVIAPLTGPEVVTGSTRMKAGTATKLILNTITTAAMVRLGKTYGNLMIDLRVTSAKLEDRGRRILREMLAISYEEAGELLTAADGRVKTALVMHQKRVGRDEADQLLAAADGFLRRVWES